MSRLLSFMQLTAEEQDEFGQSLAELRKAIDALRERPASGAVSTSP